jgi:hypothetical protein
VQSVESWRIRRIRCKDLLPQHLSAFEAPLLRSGARKQVQGKGIARFFAQDASDQVLSFSEVSPARHERGSA